jgi:uncharacterized protein (DUF2141 family)
MVGRFHLTASAVVVCALVHKNIAGIPVEGYGVTNNPKPALRAATFKEATFTLPGEGATMTISLQYFD